MLRKTKIVDAAGARGFHKAIDLDAAAFHGRKDSAELTRLVDGTNLIGTVYLRISATPAPHLLPLEMRLVHGPKAAVTAAAPAVTPPSVFAVQ